MDTSHKALLLLALAVMALGASALFWFNSLAATTEPDQTHDTLAQGPISPSGASAKLPPVPPASQEVLAALPAPAGTPSQPAPAPTASPVFAAPLPAATPDKETILSNLVQYSSSYQATALPLIAPYLSSSDPEIEEAAVNAIVVIGSPAGAPLLRQAAGAMKDPHDAAALLDKADYLELPSAK